MNYIKSNRYGVSSPPLAAKNTKVFLQIPRCLRRGSSFSVHTVNTHRQRILEKLEVGNSMEAIQYATSLGLLV